jgi:hypothetical protein
MFNDGPAVQHTHLDLVQNWFILPLVRLGVKEDASFQQDGGREYYALPVRLLGKTFVKISDNVGLVVGFLLLPAPLDWPLRSPNLSTRDNSLCSFPKGDSCTAVLPNQ